MTHGPDLLATIVAATRTAVSVRESSAPARTLEPRREPRGEAFRRALAESAPPRVIAECKRRSPSKGILRPAYDPVRHARSYAEAGAAALSILTEPTFFDGSPDHLRAVREAVDLPLLRKDFIVTEYQVHEAAWLGADAILLIVGALGDDELRRLLARCASLSLAALVEVHDREELARAIDCGATIVGVNTRNLRTLAVDLSVLDGLAAALPPGVVTVAESGIRSGEDIRRYAALGFDAFLVGERLITQEDPGAALREVRSGWSA